MRTRAGDTLNAMNPQLESKISRTPNGCWTWTGYRDKHGYGKVNYGGRPPRGRVHFAHKLVYELSVGPVPEGLELDHICQNKSCVNPAHLEPVTHSVNILRARKQTHCTRGHALIGDNVRIAPHNGQRVCRACHKIREAERRERNRLKGQGLHGDAVDC